MPTKWRVILAALAVLVIGLLVLGGGSSDHKSEWGSSEKSQLEGVIAPKNPAFTSEGVKCVSEGIEAAFSPSAFEGSTPPSSLIEKEESIGKKCAETSSNVQGSLSQACQEEGPLGEKCLEEVTNQATEELGLGSEGEEGTYPEEYPEYGEENEVESNPEAEAELNSELQQEEQESVENGENPPIP